MFQTESKSTSEPLLTHDREAIAGFLEGWITSTGFYDVFGGGIVANTTCAAANIGVGLGDAGLTAGSYSKKMGA